MQLFIYKVCTYCASSIPLILKNQEIISISFIWEVFIRKIILYFWYIIILLYKLIKRIEKE